MESGADASRSMVQPGWLAAIRLLHPFPSMLVAGLSGALVLVADREADAAVVLATGGGMLAYQFAIGVVNDLVDVSDDEQAKPWKPIARGVVSVGAARALAGILVVGGLALTATLPIAAWLLGIAALSCGMAYDLYLKRTMLSWAPFVVAFPLVPLFAFAAAGTWNPLLWWTMPLGIVLGTAVHLANQAPDVSEQAAEQRLGLPGLIGEHRARLAAVALFAAVGTAVVGILASDDPPRAAIAAAVTSVVSAASRWSGRLGRDGLFGLLALGGAGLAAVFVSAAS